MSHNVSKYCLSICLAVGVAACQVAETKPVTQAQPSCQSFNKSDNLSPQIGAAPLRLKPPVARKANPNQGKSVVLLVSPNDETHIFWLHQGKEGNWAIAQKQTLVRIKPGEIDAQLMHRLLVEAFPKTVLFVSLPQSYWDKTLIVQPILEPKEARWGKLQTYRLRMTAQGVMHPFRGLEGALSGESLPPNLNTVMNQIEAGSIYVPSFYQAEVKLEQPATVNPDLCPIAKS